MKRIVRGAVIALAICLVASGCTAGDDPGGTDAATDDATPAELMPLTLRLPDAVQGRFAGYVIAADQGYFEDAGLDVEILLPGDDIPDLDEDGGEDGGTPDDSTRPGTPGDSAPDGDTSGDSAPESHDIFDEDTTENDDTVADALADGRLDIVVAEPSDMLTPFEEEDGPIGIAQISGALGEWSDADSARPDANNAYADAIWADSARLEEDEAYADAAVRFLEAVVRGWIFARDAPDEAAAILRTHAGITADEALASIHAVNALIWPAEAGIGIIAEEDWQEEILSLTADNRPGEEVGTAAFTNAYIERALDSLENERIDLTGERAAAVRAED